jgi:hypothetical protein
MAEYKSTCRWYRHTTIGMQYDVQARWWAMTTKLCDRRSDEISLDEVEKIAI